MVDRWSHGVCRLACCSRCSGRGYEAALRFRSPLRRRHSMQRQQICVACCGCVCPSIALCVAAACAGGPRQRRGEQQRESAAAAAHQPSQQKQDAGVTERLRPGEHCAVRWDPTPTGAHHCDSRLLPPATRCHSRQPRSSSTSRPRQCRLATTSTVCIARHPQSRCARVALCSLRAQLVGSVQSSARRFA